ncbi:MAG TPA: hypothetical protein VIJ01_08965 [Candidatus Angelobacter sp.]
MVALVQGNAVLSRGNVVILGILGTLFFFGGTIGLKWHKAPYPIGTVIRTCLLFFLSAGVMVAVCIFEWPKSSQTIADLPNQKSEKGAETAPAPAPTPTRPTQTLSAAEIAKEVAKRLPGNQPQLHIIKGKAIDLADEITQFNQRRKSLVATAHNPSGIPNETGQDIQSRVNALRQNSPAIFEQTFSQRLKESISELKSVGIYTGDVEEQCQHVMYLSMAPCGDELRKAANKIPAS